MSGYLTRLLRHTFDPLAAKVEPRLNTLFSPPGKSSAWPPQKVEVDSVESTPVNKSRNDSENAAAGVSVPAARRSVNAPLVTTAPVRLHSPLPPALAPRSSGNVIHGENKNEDGTYFKGALAPSHGVREVREALDSEQSLPEQGESESSVSSPAARTQQEKSKITARAAPPDSSQMKIASFDREGNESFRQESRPFRFDRGFLVPAAPPTAERSERVRRQLGVSASLLSGDGKATSPKGEKYKVLRAAPLRASERSEAAGVHSGLEYAPSSTGSSSAEFNFEHPPLSLFPAQFRERGRRGPEASSSAEPIIEVTIGRIEVRGAASPEPQRGSSQPSRGPNLEEYLRRRSGRSRE